MIDYEVRETNRQYWDGAADNWFGVTALPEYGVLCVTEDELHLFGDVATELLIRYDGDEGLFCAYDKVEFLAPVYAGDYIEAVGEIERVGNTSRTMTFEARKVIRSRTDISASAAEFLEEPIVVCRAHGTCVTPKDCQRIEHK